MVKSAYEPSSSSGFSWAQSQPDGIIISKKYNSPFPSSGLPLCQNESKCETILMKMCFTCTVHFHANQTHFHMTSFAQRLVLAQRKTRTRKWSIAFRSKDQLEIKVFQGKKKKKTPKRGNTLEKMASRASNVNN